MEMVLKIAALCFAVSLLAALQKRSNPEMGLLLAAGTLLVTAAMLVGAAGELRYLGETFTALCGLSPEVFIPLLKTVGIAIITRIGTAFCRDAGQAALAAMLDIAGAVCALVVAVPLLCAVIELLEGWM